MQWRTLIIVPEVADEVLRIDQVTEYFNRLQNLLFMKAEVFRGLNADVSDRAAVVCV